MSGWCGSKRSPAPTIGVMKALFVPQGGQVLKVFGHVGDERFTTSAHLLGTEPLPEKTQTAEPTAPALQGKPVK